MSALIGLFIEISSWVLVKTIKLAWRGGTWLIVGTQPPNKSEEEKRTEIISQELHLITEKLDKLSREVHEEKKMKESLTLRKSA
jgi:hypothetical protein